MPAAGRVPSIEVYRQAYKDRFFYQLYFREPGVAEADVRRSLRIIYYATSGEGQKAGARIENPTGPGWLDR